ncbi:hypothetical protein AN477_09670 [Alicyclobacillus ferrooxydans]|uniref:Uncharacterized protein n=1 Tax=Alicyclobacillus ferrooxydans TaxID=471514 RepID=A0A0P9CED6_9BACL|nr:hypothetical protein AN477_09670 [Alicyclobacillus ferrooxydans]
MDGLRRKRNVQCLEYLHQVLWRRWYAKELFPEKLSLHDAPASSTVQTLFDLHFQHQNSTYQQKNRAAARFRDLDD